MGQHEEQNALVTDGIQVNGIFPTASEVSRPFVRCGMTSLTDKAIGQYTRNQFKRSIKW
jgi:hypothetical protein